MDEPARQRPSPARVRSWEGASCLSRAAARRQEPVGLMPVYLIFLLVFFAVPGALLGWAHRDLVSRCRRPLLWCFAFVFTLGAFWDWLAVRTGVWRYDSAPTLGVWIDGLPVEEFLGFYLLGTFLIGVVCLVALRRWGTGGGAGASGSRRSGTPAAGASGSGGSATPAAGEREAEPRPRAGR